MSENLFTILSIVALSLTITSITGLTALFVLDSIVLNSNRKPWEHYGYDHDPWENM